MTQPLFLFRPEPGWTHSAEKARGLGLEVDGAPLFTVDRAEWSAPAPSEFDGLLAGSANVFRYGGAGLDSLKALPVYAVGEGTAVAARDAGFEVAAVGSADLQTLVGALANRPLRLLRLRGEAHVALNHAPQISVEERAVYRTSPCRIGAALGKRLAAGGVAALHSGEAARQFAAECDRLQIDRSRLILAVLAPRIADAAGGGWRSVHAAERVADSDLLALAGALCQTD